MFLNILHTQPQQTAVINNSVLVT